MQAPEEQHMIHRVRWLSKHMIAGVAVVATLALVSCGGASSTAAATPTDTPVPPTATTAPTAASGAPMITMGATSFTHNAATVKAGQAVTFDDPGASGGTHLLVTGHSGTFTAEAGAPSEFATASGVSFSPGDSKSIVFPTAGTYTITCTIHPTMQATITVTP
jgi:plastocyanin